MNNNIQEILKQIRETDVNELFPNSNVKMVGWGPKIKDGKETGEYALIVYVDKKQPSWQVPENQLIPSLYTFSNVDYITDVQVPQLHEHLNTPSNKRGFISHYDVAKNAKANKSNTTDRQQAAEILTYGDCNTVSDTVEPVKTNRIRRRALRAGCESIGGANTWGSYVGTLGTFVLDKSDRQVVALSNNHVFGSSQARANVPNTVFTNTSKLSAYQPSGYWKTTIENDYIGMCKRPVVIGNINSSVTSGIIGSTSCDASIVSLKDNNLLNDISAQPIGFNSDQVFYKEFATDQEIDSLLNPTSINFGAPVFRSGRTCGPIGYPGTTTTCSLSVYQFSPTLVGGYNGYVASFTDCFFFRGTTVPGRGGDSGSMVLALFNQGTSEERWKIIGLLFAGPASQFPEYSIGCRITNIARDLGVVPWNGVTLPTTASETRYVVLNSTQSNNYSATVSLSGRTFYQLGKS